MTAQSKFLLASILAAGLLAVLAAPALAGGDLKAEQGLTVNVPQPGNNPPNTNGPGDPPKPPEGYAAFELFFLDAFVRPHTGGTQNYGLEGQRPARHVVTLTPEQLNEMFSNPVTTTTGDVVPIAGDSGPPIDEVM